MTEEVIDFEYSEFSVIDAVWNEYILEDKTILKSRFILAKLIKEKESDETGTPVFTVNSSNVFSTFVPKELRGKPDMRTYSIQELFASIVAEDLKFETVKEEWNQYKLEADKATMSVKLTLVKASRTGKYNGKGEPIYLIDARPIAKTSLL